MKMFELTRTAVDEKIEIRQLEAMVGEMRKILATPVYGNEEAWRGYVQELTGFQHSQGGFPILDTYHVESDARVEFCHVPTYLGTAILMKALVEDRELLAGKERSILPPALKMCCARGLKGHGFDDFSGQLEAMDIFHRGHVMEFLAEYPDFCPEFTEMIYGILAEYRQCIQEKRFIFGFAKNYEREIRAVVKTYETKSVFVYGTLMEGRRNYQAYLSPKKPEAEGVIHGFRIFSLGAYPGIVRGASSVPGEVFAVSPEKLAELDEQGNGRLYNRIWTEVQIGKTSLPAYVYVYCGGKLEGLPKVYVVASLSGNCELVFGRYTTLEEAKEAARKVSEKVAKDDAKERMSVEILEEEVLPGTFVY